jgi:hypothetical protein
MSTKQEQVGPSLIQDFDARLVVGSIENKKPRT